MLSNHQQEEERIKNIFKNSKNYRVSDETTELYAQYLQENISHPCLLTGSEDFRWEEFYVFGPGSKKEYEELKKKHASYTDEFLLIKFEEITSGEIYVRVKRMSDKKRFTLALSDLKVLDEKSGNCQLFGDFASWTVNYQ